MWVSRAHTQPASALEGVWLGGSHTMDERRLLFLLDPPPACLVVVISPFTLHTEVTHFEEKPSQARSRQQKEEQPLQKDRRRLGSGWHVATARDRVVVGRAGPGETPASAKTAFAIARHWSTLHSAQAAAVHCVSSRPARCP